MKSVDNLLVKDIFCGYMSKRMSYKLQNMQKFSEKRRFGNLGEDIAEMFLVKQGYATHERNYLKKWGELDLVSQKGSILHFIEVKTVSDRHVSHETSGDNVSRYVSHDSFTKNEFKISLSRETSHDDEYLPEENVHYWKQKRMIRAIQTYLIERNIDEDQEWQIDIITVKIDFLSKTAIIKHIENVVFDV